MNANKIILLMILSCCFVAQTAWANNGDLKNFIMQPDMKVATFDDSSVTISDGIMTSDFLSITSSAASSRIEEQGDNKYLVFEDGVDDSSAAVLTITPPGNCAYERFIFSYDICMPDMYAGRTNPVTNKAVASMKLDFNAVDDTLSTTGRPVYYNYSRIATGTKWVYLMADTEYPWLGDSGLDFNKWYTVRYEVNLKTHRYNIYLHERDSGSLVAKYVNRQFRDRSNAGATFAIDNYYIKNIAVSVNAQNNGSAINVLLDNISFVKEKFYLPEKPEIVVTADGFVTARVTVQNETLSDLQSPMLVLGIYGNNNKLIDVKYATVMAGAKGASSKPSKSELVCSLKKPLLGNGYEARAMLLTSLYNGKAYFPSKSLPLN